VANRTPTNPLRILQGVNSILIGPAITASTQDMTQRTSLRHLKAQELSGRGNLTVDQTSQDRRAARLHASGRVPPRMSAAGLGGRDPRIPRTLRRRPLLTAAFPVAALRAVFVFLQKRSARAAAPGAGLLCTMALVVAPPAYANVDLAVGMPINIGNHGCSLGFFGFDARQDRLAVTAGHCSDSMPNEPVYAENGVQIGEVVAWKEDLENTSGKLIGARGYTIISVYSRFSLEPFFTGVSSSISDGDYVTKFGQRTGKTNGVIKNVEVNPKRPDLALLSSNMVQLPGDSGCPWYTGGDALVGMGSSSDQEQDGGDAGSQAQPIQAVLDLIRANADVWGDDFKVWTQ
jgi:hypothetical protein